MCLGLGMYNSVQANTKESKTSISQLKGLMVAELCVAMCKMFIFQDIFNGLMELFTCLLLYLAYSQLSFCWCIVYVLYCMYQILIYAVVLLTLMQNGTPLFPGGIVSAQSGLMFILIIFYTIACYFGFQAYKNFKGELFERGGINIGDYSQEQQRQDYEAYNGYNQQGGYQQQRQQQQQNQGFQAFSGQGVRLG